jgi:uncharacterized protein (DUF934 family)
MKLLENGAVVTDSWITPEQAEGPWADAPAIVSVEEYAAASAQKRNQPVGVRLQPDQNPAVLKPWLADLPLVAVTFPIFRDGRAFTQARALREYLGFSGIIRAEGHILPDQYGFLLRCGVTSVALPDDADVGVWEAAACRFDIAYQHGLKDGPAIGVGLRRHLHLVD